MPPDPRDLPRLAARRQTGEGRQNASATSANALRPRPRAHMLIPALIPAHFPSSDVTQRERHSPETTSSRDQDHWIIGYGCEERIWHICHWIVLENLPTLNAKPYSTFPNHSVTQLTRDVYGLRFHARGHPPGEWIRIILHTNRTQNHNCTQNCTI